jgi:hypothetical protein
MLAALALASGAGGASWSGGNERFKLDLVLPFNFQLVARRRMPLGFTVKCISSSFVHVVLYALDNAPESELTSFR